MSAMMGPNGVVLPVATGAAAMAMSGGDRPETITRDGGDVSAAPREAPAKVAPRESIQEPKDEEEVAASAPTMTPPAAEPDASDNEIDALHARFDKMEAELKRRLAVATLHGRFDALEAWLAERFPG